MSICNVIRKRKSCRAYTSQPVELNMIQTILEVARWAPSGVNHQPAQVAILGPESKKSLSTRLIEKYLSGAEPSPDYEFCPRSWPDPYKARRKACGDSLYNSLKIQRGDVEGKRTHWCRNYNFFQAPVGLIIYLEKDMPKGSWLDVGLFIQNVLLAAEGLGLASCPQAAFADYPDVVREILSLSDVDIVCGIALGYEDSMHPLNSYRTERESVNQFSRWYD